jgi:type IV conjugative transfer system protein TraE
VNNQKYTSILLDHSSQIKRLWKLVFILASAVVLLTIFIFTLKKNEKTIIVPSSFNKPFSVTGTEYSNEYKEQMAKYVLQLLLTFQPNNVKYQFNEVLRYVHPSAYATMRAKLSTEASQIVTNGSSSVFYISSITTDGNTVSIKGELVGSVGDQIVSRQTNEFKVTISTQDGFYIMGWAKVIPDGTLQPEADPANQSSAPKEDFLGKPNQPVAQ